MAVLARNHVPVLTCTSLPGNSEDHQARYIEAAAITAAKAQSRTSTPQPSPEIESLAKAVTGKWLLSVKSEPSASVPNDLANSGEETWRRGPGGFTLLEEEHLHMTEGELFLLGVVWWNIETNSKKDGKWDFPD